MTEELSQAQPVQDAAPIETAQEPSPVPEVKPDEPQTEKPKEQVPGWQKRIDKLYARNKNYEQQLEATRAELAELKKAQAAKDPEADKPKADSFNTPEEYAEALADWKLEQKTKAEAAPKPPNVDDLVKQKLEFEKKRETFTQREAEFKAKTPEYEKSSAYVNQLLGMADRNHPSFQTFSQVLLENTDKAPEIIHYLGSNPQEALAMFNKSPSEIEDALTVIIDGLAQPQQEPLEDGPEEEVLPPPPAPVKGVAKRPKTPDQMSGKELLAHINRINSKFR